MFQPNVHVLYIDSEYVALSFHNREPRLVKRTQGEGEPGKIDKILRQIKMTAIGEPYLKESGHWCLSLKGDGDVKSGNNNR